MDTQRVVTWVFDADADADAAADRALRSEVDRTEDFIRDQLGDARSFSLDSPKSRAPRIAALRSA